MKISMMRLRDWLADLQRPSSMYKVTLAKDGQEVDYFTDTLPESFFTFQEVLEWTLDENEALEGDDEGAAGDAGLEPHSGADTLGGINVLVRAERVREFPRGQDDVVITNTFRGEWYMGRRGAHYLVAAVLGLAIGSIVYPYSTEGPADLTVAQARDCLEAQASQRPDFDGLAFDRCMGHRPRG